MVYHFWIDWIKLFQKIDPVNTKCHTSLVGKVDTIIYLIAVRNQQTDTPPGISLREKPEGIRLILANVNIASSDNSTPYHRSISAGDKPRSVQRIYKPLSNNSTGSNHDSFSINTMNIPTVNGHIRSKMGQYAALANAGNPTVNRHAWSKMSGQLRYYHESTQHRRMKRHQDNNLRKQIASLLIALAPYLEHTHSCSTIYDTVLLNWLEAQGQWDLWQNFWPYYAFTAYRDPIFVNPLLQYAHAPHYLIIGFDPYVTELVTARARRMKSLRLLLDYGPKGLGDFLDDLYEEYGLPASFTMLPDQSGQDTDWDTDTATHPFKHALIECHVPSVIVDYSEETNLRITSLAPGSLWLDIYGDDEKHRRLNMQFPDIAYMSIKTLWRDHTIVHEVAVKT
jgi:hypothetical protein